MTVDKNITSYLSLDTIVITTSLPLPTDPRAPQQDNGRFMREL
jgi:hypothetical protein